MYNHFISRLAKIIFIFVMLLPIMAMPVNILGNNIRAYLFANQLRDILLPPKIKLVDIRSSTNQYPGRTECIIVGQALYKTDLPIEQVYSYFDKLMNDEDTALHMPLLSKYSLPLPLRNAKISRRPQWRIDTPTEFSDITQNNPKVKYIQLTIASSILPSRLDARCWGIIP